AGGSDCGAELVGECLDILREAFGATDTATARDDDFGFGERDAGAALCGFAGDLEARGGEIEIDVELFGGFGARRRGVENTGLDGDDGDGAGGPSHGLDGFRHAQKIEGGLRG